MSAFPKSRLIKGGILLVDPNSVLPQEASKLTSAVSELKKQPNLSAESHVALSKAQLAIGEKEEAATNLHKALKEKPNVAVDPRLRALVTATPQP